ncbi:hypothetical protein JD844_018917 [Phrynosoma platyrhinos]|uniref:Uncharacterized protein n=1 Tax=Phrynosoma platyrhinos TaxID=52577 RepID=A0ABQ7SP96_PHRPL|nr:hypothetical protein JD844_018917 [Phrynosoma platyrhinos]
MVVEGLGELDVKFPPKPSSRPRLCRSAVGKLGGCSEGGGIGQDFVSPPGPLPMPPLPQLLRCQEVRTSKPLREGEKDNLRACEKKMKSSVGTPKTKDKPLRASEKDTLRAGEHKRMASDNKVQKEESPENRQPK